MFDQAQAQRGDTGRSRALIAIFGVVLALVVAGALAYSRFSPEPEPTVAAPQRGLENAVRAGNPEFDGLVKVVQLRDLQKQTARNLLGQHIGILKGQIANMSDKTITGIELRGNAYGMDSKVVATSLALPVPRVRESIPPHSTMPFTVTIDAIPDPKKVADMTVDIEGLEVK
jgi:hypothetical protein